MRNEEKETAMMKTCVIRGGRLHVNGEVLPIRPAIVQAGLAVYGMKTGRYLWSGADERPIPGEAVDEILEIERRSSLALLELSLEEALVAA